MNKYKGKKEYIITAWIIISLLNSLYIIFKNSESSDDDDSDDESSEDEAAPVKKEAPKAKAEKGLLNKYLKNHIS